MESSLAYHEPSITTIAILVSFLLLLNVVNHVLDTLIYCGLIGQVLLGIAWGTPGAKWLSREIEDAAMQLGYLGLLLIVYEGGLATSFRSLKANMLLSVGVALTGILTPMGLSFILQPMVGASPLQAFAAGAALCSTSLGTTFTILGTSGLSSTRLGVVLTSAAMMDDVVGLIMVQVISNLGGDNFDATTVVRPVLVSIAFAVVAPLTCWLLARPLTVFLNAKREACRGGMLDKLLSHQHTALAIHTITLIGLVVGGTFAGTSGLFAAYIAGASVSWWDSELPHPAQQNGRDASSAEQTIQASDSGHGRQNSREEAMSDASRSQSSGSSGLDIYENYYRVAVERVLKPFFFASIGFSIPVSKMFSGAVVWRGMVYAVLMAVAKLACGIWLISFASPLHAIHRLFKKVSIQDKVKSERLAQGKQCAASVSDIKDTHMRQPQTQTTTSETRAAATTATANGNIVPKNASPNPEMPVSVYPACILASAMVARGEIGFLISALAEANGILGRSSDAAAPPSELFLVITWAISLCTIGGPICVGLLVSRVKRLEAIRSTAKKRNVLGSWGIS